VERESTKVFFWGGILRLGGSNINSCAGYTPPLLTGKGDSDKFAESHRGLVSSAKMAECREDLKKKVGEDKKGNMDRRNKTSRTRRTQGSRIKGKEILLAILNRRARKKESLQTPADLLNRKQRSTSTCAKGGWPEGAHRGDPWRRENSKGT